MTHGLITDPDLHRHLRGDLQDFPHSLNKWTVPTAVLGGVVLIGALIFLMNYNHPYSEVARSYYVSVPIIPAVTGKVIEVPVKGNEP